MTSSSRSLGVKLLLGVLLLAGCGKNDGVEEYREGCAAFEEGDLTAAAQDFRASLVYAPENVDTLLMLARTELARGEFPAAREVMAKAAALAGGEPDVLELEGQAAFQAQDYAAARTCYTKLADTADFPASVRSRGWGGLGVLEYAAMTPKNQEEQAARARTAFLTALQLDFRNAAAHYHLGRLYADVYQYLAFAKSEYELFVGLAPKDDVRSKRVREALLPEMAKRLAAVKSAKPTAAAALIALGDKALAERSPAYAEAAYSRALAASPRSATALAKLIATMRKNGKTRLADIYQRYAATLATLKR